MSVHPSIYEVDRRALWNLQLRIFIVVMKSFLRRLCEVSSTDIVERSLPDVSSGVKAKSLLTVAWSGWCLRRFRRADSMHSFARCMQRAKSQPCRLLCGEVVCIP